VIATNNPLQTPLDELFQRLNGLYGLLHHFKSYLNTYRSLLNEMINTGKLKKSDLAAGTSLVIRDLTEFPQNGWAVYYSTGSFFSQGEAYFQMIDLLLSQNSAWTISQGYEAFETFIKDITAFSLYENSEFADRDKLCKFKKKFNEQLPEHLEINSWKEFVRYSYKISELLNIIRKITPELKKAEKNNNRNIDLTEWFKVISEVRHAVTHSGMLIKKNKLTKIDYQFLVRLFHGKDTNDGYLLEPSTKDAEHNLVSLAEYSISNF
jgi:hypothetical protein